MAIEDRIRSYMRLTGMNASRMEAAVWDQMLHDANALTGSGVSAAHILELANSQGIPIYHITGDNILEVLPRLQVPSDIKNNIQSSVNAGKEVTIPEREITVDDWWTGVGYVVEDLDTGAGAYLISGGINGGRNKIPSPDPMAIFLLGCLLAVIGVIFSSLIIGILLAVISIAIGLWSLAADIQSIMESDLSQEQKELLIAGVAAFFIMGAIIAVIGIFSGGVGAFVAIALYYAMISIIASSILVDFGPLIGRRADPLGG